MLDPITLIPNRFAVKNLPSDISSLTKVEGNDVVEISKLGKARMQYLQILGNLPDVREDVVQRIRKQNGSVVRYLEIAKIVVNNT